MTAIDVSRHRKIVFWCGVFLLLTLFSISGIITTRFVPETGKSRNDQVIK